LELVAGSLVDEELDVRVAAAYSLASVAGKVGCSLEKLDECQKFKGVLDATPKATKKVPPKYPLEAKERGFQGVVRMEILVTETGSVERIRILSGPQPLQKASEDAVKQWRYEPARRGGQAVPFAMLFRMTFKLN
jgi:TonB family protein